MRGAQAQIHKAFPTDFAMRKTDHEKRLAPRARELAKSGRFKSGFFVIAALETQHGEPLAMQILWKEPFKSELDRICAEARERKGEARHAAWAKRPEDTG